MIPNEFYLFGSKWSVIFDNDYLDNIDAYGECSYTERIIRLARKSNGNIRSQESIEETFFHELFHAILDMAEYHKLPRVGIVKFF